MEHSAISRGFYEADIPMLALNHWRFSSTNETRAIGVLQIYEASWARSSKACSGSLSRMAYFCRAATRAASLLGADAAMAHLPENRFEVQSKVAWYPG